MRSLVSILCTVLAFSGLAITVDPQSTAVRPGVWCGNFPAATNYVSQHDLPLVMVWGMQGCDHCTALMDQLGSPEGLSWSSGKNAVFCFVEGDKSGYDVSPNLGAGDFTGGIYGVGTYGVDYLLNTPFVRFYWPRRSSVRFEGRLGSMSSKEGTTLLAQFTNSFEKFLSEVPLEKSYATFPMGDHPCDRLEAIRGVTKFVDVPVVRTNDIGVAASATLTFACRGASWTEGVSWAVGETRAFVRCEIPSDVTAGDAVDLTLTDADKTVLATRQIHVLAEDYENSPKNPFWFGERTAATLEWGDWTMDIDAALQKARSFNATRPAKRAYVMMFVGGSCWCPDCAMAEANFYSKKAFKDWAKANQVVFGVVDIPNRSKTSPEAETPSQLHYESSRTSDAFVTLRGSATADETQRYQSGAGYLSRHSVPFAGNGGTNATEIAARNRFLMDHTTLEGGWNRPERASVNPYRTGVPVLLLLRDDGTVAARWNRFSDVGPKAYSDGYLRRFEEMMAQVADEYEENDDDRSTTMRTVASGDAVSSMVSAVDQADVYALRDAVENEVFRFRVTGDAMSLRAVLIDGTTGTELAAADGLAAEGFTLVSKLRSSVTPYYLKVAPKAVADGTSFGFTNAASTVCRYAVAVTSGESGGDFGFTVATLNVMENDGAVKIEVRRTAGSNGAASVKVRLVEASGEAVEERIEWTDADLSWATGEEGAKSATLTVKPDGLVRHDMRLRFELTDLACEAEDKAVTCGSLTVNVYDVDYFGLPILRHVAVEDMRTVVGYQPGDEVLVAPMRGTLPEGLSVVNDGGRVGMAGYAFAEAGEYSATYAVTLMRDASEVSTQSMTFDYTVIDYDFSGTIPSVAKVNTYGNLPFVEGGLVKGALTVTVPPDGRISAKYTVDGKTFAYASDGWASFDRTKGLSADLECTTPGVVGMRVELSAAGGLATVADPSGGEDPQTFVLTADLWPRGATAWQGQYTVQMPQTNILDGAAAARLGGAAYMAMRMTEEDAVDGRMLYAGVLPNGRAVYGSSVLLPSPDDATEARLPFYHASDMRTAPFVLSGGFAIRAGAATDSENLWCVTSSWPTFWEVRDGFGRMAEFNVYGGYYDPDTITAKFTSDLGDLDNLAVFVGVSSIASGRYGQGLAVSPVAAEMTATNCPQLVEGAENPQLVTLRFSPCTGVVSGEFNLPFEDLDVAVTYRGIALLGWQNCAECSRRHFVERPWAAGSFSFSDRDRKAGAFRNGGVISLDKLR